MALRKLARAAVAGTLLVCGAAGAAAWRPVPGAPDTEIDVTSLQQEGTRLVVWLRWWGSTPLLNTAAAGASRPHRTTVRTEFDCAHRTMRVLAGNAYDSAGAVLFMSSTPGPVLPVRGNDLHWAYDALCEAARATGRF